MSVIRKRKKLSAKKLQKGAIGGFFVYAVVGILMILGYMAVGGLPSINPSSQTRTEVDVLNPSQNSKHNTLQLQTFAYVTLTPAPTSTQNPTISPASSSTSLKSGVPIPTGNLSGWKLIFSDDFTKDAPLGSWGTTNASKIVYTGDHGGQWEEYPDGWPSTYTSGASGYQPAQVLSVHDGVLDFYLHDVNGLPSGANPSPVLPGGSQYQTYGRYEFRFMVTGSLSDYYAAWLLWPESDSDGPCAESDFPEGELNSTIAAYAHYGCSGSQDAFSTTATFNQWHTFVQQWSPGERQYYIDGNLIGTSTSSVWSQPERFQLQTEPKGSCASCSGHLYVDWIVIYAYDP